MLWLHLPPRRPIFQLCIEDGEQIAVGIVGESSCAVDGIGQLGDAVLWSWVVREPMVRFSHSSCTIGTIKSCIKRSRTHRPAEGTPTMRQTIKARYHDGVLQPLEPLALADDTEVQVTVETAIPVSAEDILQRAARVYQGFTAEEVAQVEAIALTGSTSSANRLPNAAACRHPRH